MNANNNEWHETCSSLLNQCILSKLMLVLHFLPTMPTASLPGRQYRSTPTARGITFTCLSQKLWGAAPGTPALKISILPSGLLSSACFLPPYLSPSASNTVKRGE